MHKQWLEMRKDIEIHINTGDITLSPHNKFILRPFNWVENESGLMRYIYGEITLPATLSEDVVRKGGIYTTIPYTPIYKEFYVRIKRNFEAMLYPRLQITLLWINIQTTSIMRIPTIAPPTPNNTDKF